MPHEGKVQKTGTERLTTNFYKNKKFDYQWDVLSITAVSPPISALGRASITFYLAENQSSYKL